MQVHITSWYSETVMDIIHNNIDSDTEPTFKNNSRVELVYVLENDNLFQEYDKWLNYAGHCDLVKSYKIER